MRQPVPHGFKGLDLFEMLFSPATSLGSNRASSLPSSAAPSASLTTIPVDRAIWLIRVLGANEISAHRARALGQIPASGTGAAAAVASPAGVATPSSNNTGTGNAAPMLVIGSNDWYTGEFTGLFCSWLRVQLNQMILPSAKGKMGSAAPGPKTNLGVLADEKSRAKWSAKWEYRYGLGRYHC
jgi:mediator of RNA polymerase II transcription subunit 12